MAASPLPYILLFQFVAFMVMLYLRMFPKKYHFIYQAWFGLTLVITLLCTGALCWLWHHLLPLLGVSKKKTEDICVGTGWFCYNAHLLWNPQVRVHWKDATGFKNWQNAPPRAAMMANHISNFDPFIATASAPYVVISSSRSYVKASLTKLPVFKWYFKGSNHFPVHFTSKSDGNFALDKEKQEAVGKHVQTHLKRGGRLAMYPEGAVNKTPKKGLQPFRIGTFNTVIEHKLPLAMIVFAGVEDCWPAKCAMGGFPADIYLHYINFPHDANEDAAHLAERMQAAMQKEVDDLKAVKAAAGGGNAEAKKKEA